MKTDVNILSCTSLYCKYCIHMCKYTQLCPGVSVCLQTLFNCLVCSPRLHDVHGGIRFTDDCLCTIKHINVALYQFSWYHAHTHTQNNQLMDIMFGNYTFLCVHNYFLVCFFGTSTPSLFAFPCFISFFSICWNTLNLQSLPWTAPVRCLRGDLARSAPAAHSGAVQSQW